MIRTKKPGPVTEARFIPALSYDRLTWLYDPIMRLTMREAAFKSKLIEQACIKADRRVLDLGCGTATLSILVKRRYPGADVIGIDGDPKILAIARRKVKRAGVEVSLEQGMSFELPVADESIDRVLSSLMLHHLTREDKRRTLREVYRVLKPGGELHVADWGRPQNLLMRGAFLMVQVLDGFETTLDNVDGLLPGLFREAGFTDVREANRFWTTFGTVALYSARKPE